MKPSDDDTLAVARSRVRAFADAQSLATQRGVKPPPEFWESLYCNIEQSYLEDAPRGRLFSNSDLIIHAEGPGAQDHTPEIDVVTWLGSSIEKSLFSLLGAGARHLDKIRDSFIIRLTGFAPGSLYMGFSVAPRQGIPLFPGDVTAEEISHQAVRALPTVSRFIGDEKIDNEIVDVFFDPEYRDTALMAAYNLAPTGRRGIHTLDIMAGNHDVGTLDTKDRVVLRHTVKHNPVMRRAERGAFIGEVREVDLDAQRFKLKTQDGTIRCAFAMEVKAYRSILGAAVRVSGTYETDQSGRPRMMRAEQLEKTGEQLTFDSAGSS